jgi:phage-related protein
MELFRLLGRIAIENSEANSAIDDTTGKAEKSEGRMSKAFKKVGAVIATCFAVDKIVDFGKACVNMYADYEQLIGGVETLFKDSASIVTKYAENAYKTAGLSANQYMETVTSFSASLLQSLGGDTEEAAKKADLAITDMADNANKMGTSMESIQNAYQGFAKQNYTMLDNLKLGYGGTKEEMARLLADATAISGVHYDVSSYADVVDAIHVIQTEMGITGTTAKEASETIAGSAASMKGAWQNFITGLGDDNADLSGLTSQLVTSVVTYGRNLIPRIGKIVGSIFGVIKQEVPKFIKKIPSLVREHLPAVAEKILESAKELFGLQDADFLNFGGMFESISTFWEANGKPVFDAITSIFSQIDQSTVFENLQNGFQLLWEVVGEIWNSVGQPIWDGVMSAIQYVADNWQPISEKISTLFQTAWDLCNTAWTSIGQPIWDLISSAIGKVKDLFSENMPQIMEFFDDAIEGIKDTWENHLKPVFEAIEKILKEVVQPAFEFVWETIIEPLIENTFGFIKDLWNDTLKPVFDGMCDFLTGVFTSDWETAMNGIGEIVDGVFSAIETTVESVIGFFSDAIGKIKEFLGVANEAEGVEVKTTTTTTTTTTGGVEKYASGAVLTKATAFGYNPFTGKTMIGGEAGAEAIAPIDVLQGYVRQAVAEQNQGMYMAFNRMVELLENYMPEIVANSHKQIVMNNGALVAELAPGIDRELGGIASWKGRGNR